MLVYKDVIYDKFLYLFVDLLLMLDDFYRFCIKIFKNEDIVLYIESKKKLWYLMFIKYLILLI